MSSVPPPQSDTLFEDDIPGHPDPDDRQTVFQNAAVAMGTSIGEVQSLWEADEYSLGQLETIQLRYWLDDPDYDPTER